MIWGYGKQPVQNRTTTEKHPRGNRSPELLIPFMERKVSTDVLAPSTATKVALNY